MAGGNSIARRDQAGALAPAEGTALAMWDRDQISVIKTLICPGASDTELALFGQVCQRTGLDPFARQIYGIMRGSRKQVNGEWKWVESLSIQTSIDGFRLIAERSGKYGGQLGPQWCGADGKWRDVWLGAEYPAAARVGVIRVDWKEPLWAVARWDSYVQTHKDRKTNQDVVSAMWARMPDVMLAKVAESLALRRAFPAELSGLYTSEEMAQADRDAPAPFERRTIGQVEAKGAPASGAPKPKRTYEELYPDDDAPPSRVVAADVRVVKPANAPAPGGTNGHPAEAGADGAAEAATDGDAAEQAADAGPGGLSRPDPERSYTLTEYRVFHARAQAYLLKLDPDAEVTDSHELTKTTVRGALAAVYGRIDDILAALGGGPDAAPDDGLGLVDAF